MDFRVKIEGDLQRICQHCMMVIMPYDDVYMWGYNAPDGSTYVRKQVCRECFLKGEINHTGE